MNGNGHEGTGGAGHLTDGGITLDKMLITDQKQIAEAISKIVGEESYVSLRRTDFDPEDGENEVWVFGYSD